jgi:hypothetical protein
MSLTPPPLRSGSVPASVVATAGMGGARPLPPHPPAGKSARDLHSAGFGTQTTNLGRPLPPHPPAGTPVWGRAPKLCVSPCSRLALCRRSGPCKRSCRSCSCLGPCRHSAPCTHAWRVRPRRTKLPPVQRLTNRPEPRSAMRRGGCYRHTRSLRPRFHRLLLRSTYGTLS